MGQILDPSTNQALPLRAHHTFGRDLGSVDSSITHRLASRIHAVLEWYNNSWHIRDLSRNGTWLDERRIYPQERVLIRKGDQLKFGSIDSLPWELIDDSVPCSLLLGLSKGTNTHELEPFLFLPSPDAPELVVTCTGDNSGWSVESLTDNTEQIHRRKLIHGEFLSCSDSRWRVFLAEEAALTLLSSAGNAQLDDFEFVFDLSQDEENTALKLIHQNMEIDLNERSHHYLLLHLARKRAIDAFDGMDSTSQGWLDSQQITRDLGVDISHINILIFRARKQIAQRLQHSLDSNLLIERGRGRIRFGCPPFRIFKGHKLTHQLPSSQSDRS